MSQSKIFTLSVIFSTIILFQLYTAAASDPTPIISNLGKEDNENVVADMVQTLVFETMMSDFMEGHRTFKRQWTEILDESFSHVYLQNVNVNRNYGNTFSRLFVANGKYCYTYRQSNQVSPVWYACLDVQNGAVSTASNFNIETSSLFDPVNVYPGNSNIFAIGRYHIKTRTKFQRVRLATHLANKVYFIGFKGRADLYGDLYAVNLLKENSVDESTVEIEAEKVHIGWKLQDIAVDQYTGNLFVYANDTLFHVFNKIPFAKELDTLYLKLGGKSLILPAQVDGSEEVE